MNRVPSDLAQGNTGKQVGLDSLQRDALGLRHVKQEEDNEERVQSAVEKEGVPVAERAEQGEEGLAHDGVRHTIREVLKVTPKSRPEFG